MSNFLLKGVSITAIAGAVPRQKTDNFENPIFEDQSKSQKFFESTGIRFRRISDENTCTSDLCVASAEKIFDQTYHKKEDIQLLVCVTQTPDLYAPMNAALIQDRLKLNKSTIVFDVPSGCSGFVYGIMIVGSMLKGLGLKKGMFMIGDTLSKSCSKFDPSTEPVFGDGGVACIVEYNYRETENIWINAAGDGSGWETLFVKERGYRFPLKESSLIYREDKDGINRRGIDTVMNGMNVFSFGISVPPKSINEVLNYANLSGDQIDYFIFHQASMMLVDKIRLKIKQPEHKVLSSLYHFGNTSGASIPITLLTEFFPKVKKNQAYKIVCCGFGIGLSWGSMILEIKDITSFPLIEI